MTPKAESRLRALMVALSMLALQVHSVAHAAAAVAKCGPDIKPENFVAFGAYATAPCSSSPFRIEVEFTVNPTGRISEPQLLRPQILPPDKRDCIAAAVKTWLLNAARFVAPAEPCVFRLRVTQ